MPIEIIDSSKVAGMSWFRAAWILAVVAILGACDPGASSGQVFLGHTDYVCSVQMSADGNTIYSGGADGKLKFWDVPSRQCRRSIDAHKDWVQSIALSSDGTLVVSAGRDKLLKIWNTASGEVVKSFAGTQEFVNSVAYSPDGKLLATCGSRPAVVIWDTVTGTPLKTLPTEDFFTVSSVKFAPDSRHLVVGGDRLQYWDIESAKCLKVYEGHRDSIGSVAVSRRGEWIASAGGYTDHSIKMWNAQTGDCVWTKNLNEESVWSLTFAADDNLLVSGTHGGSIACWDTRTGDKRGGTKGHPAPISSLAVDATGKILISGSWDKSIKLSKISPSAESK